jgi:hypothetical protein
MQSLVERSKTRYTVLGTTILLVGIVCTMGCGNSLYAMRANAAAIKLEEARTMGAEQRAPYEYTLAEEHLNKAMSEAAESDYGDAFNLANSAYDYADLAVQRCEQSQPQASTEAGKESAQ